MADGGTSTIIMLVTALLISTAASAVLVQEWSSTTRIIQKQQKGLQLSEEIAIDFAGDPMMVSLTTSGVSGDKQLTFYIQNTGSHVMDHLSLAVLINGESLDFLPISLDFVPLTSTTWAPNTLLRVMFENPSFNALNDNTEISLFATARSVEVSGMSMSANLNEEVRLHES